MSESSETYDPFGKDVQTAQLIVSMKIYDALMTLLASVDGAKAEALDAMHTAGTILSVGPAFSQFLIREDTGAENTNNTAAEDS